MLAHKQQDIQATRSRLELSIDPMTLERLKEAIGDLTPILQTVLQVTPARCTKLRLAVETGNHAQVESLSHLIAGSFSNLGAMKLTKLARTLEDMDDDQDAELEILTQLELEVERVTASLTALLESEHRRYLHSVESQ